MSVPPAALNTEPSPNQSSRKTTARRSRSSSAKEIPLKKPISLSEFAYQHLSPSSMSSSSTPSLSSSSTSSSPPLSFEQRPQPRKWVSHLKEKTSVPSQIIPISTPPQTPTLPTDDSSLEFFSLSPRSRGGFCHKVHNIRLQDALAESVNKTLEQLAEIRRDLPYGDMNLEEIDQTVELYFRQSVRGFLHSEKKPKNLCTILRKDMASEESPLVSICSRHLRHYALALSETTNPILKELKSVIVAMVTFDRTAIKGLEVSGSKATPLDTLIAILQKYSKHHFGEALSYIILGSTENQIEGLLRILKKWNHIDDEKMIGKIKAIQQTKVYQHTPNQEHQFKQKDIRETFVRDAGVVLPHMLTINSLPFQLKGYEGGRDKMLVDILFNLISDIHYAGLNRKITQEEIMQLVYELLTDNNPPPFLSAVLSGAEIEKLVDDFRGEKKLYGELMELLHPVLFRKGVELMLTDLTDGTETEPQAYLKAVLSQDEIERLVDGFREQKVFPEEFRYLLDPVQMQRLTDDFLMKKIAPPGYVKTLLGLGSISSRLQAFSFFSTTFPSLKELGFMCRQKQGKVRIGFNVKSDPMNCYQPITFIVYPKLSDDPLSFAIDQQRPLAEVTIGWTGYPLRVEGASDSYTHTETLEILNCEFYGEGSVSERKSILDALGLRKRFTVKSSLTNHTAQASTQDSEQLKRPSSQEADGTDRSSPSLPATSSSSSGAHYS
jgi:hypothetical protein